MYVRIFFNPSPYFHESCIFYSKDELQDIDGIGKALAEAIWNQCAKRKSASISTSEVQRQVVGIGEARRKKIERWLQFGQ